MSSKICLCCLQVVEGSSRCSKCRTALYCSRACQEKHWPVHKNICVDSNSDDSNEKLEKKAENNFEQGRYGKSEQLYRKLLKNLNKTTGEENHAIGIIRTMARLADAIYKQGRLHESENLLREALERSSRLLGHTHAWTLIITKNLAQTLDTLGKYGEAVSLFNTCLNMMSPDDPLALDVESNLAACYINQNQLALAIVSLLKIVDKKSALLGDDHSETTTARNNLAGVYMRMCFNDKAEEQFKISIRYQKETIGDTHPDCLNTSSILGGLYANMGRFSEARSLLEDISEKQKLLLGYTKETLQSLSNLSVVYERMGEHDKARQLREICLEKQKLLGGEDDPTTLRMMLLCANSISQAGRYEEAEEMYQKILQKQISFLGERHPDVEATMFGILSTYRMSGKNAEAKKLQRKMDLLFG